MYQTRNVNICQKTFLEYFQFNLSLSWKKKKIQNSIKAWKDYAKLKKKKKQSYYIHHGSFIDHDMKYIFNPFSIKHTQLFIQNYFKFI